MLTQFCPRAPTYIYLPQRVSTTVCTKKSCGAEPPPEHFVGSSVLCSAGIYFTYQKCDSKEKETFFKKKFGLLLSMHSRASKFSTEADFFLKQELKEI